MGREERVDRIVSNKACRLKPAGGDSVAEHAGLEDLEQRHPYLALLSALQPAVLEPNCRLLDKVADVDEGQRWGDADPQHAAPADVFEKEPINCARQQKAE